VGRGNDLSSSRKVERARDIDLSVTTGPENGGYHWTWEYSKEKTNLYLLLHDDDFVRVFVFVTNKK